MISRPWIRRHNYIQDYFYTVYDLYIRTYPAYPVNYYSIDKDNTIWDTETMQVLDGHTGTLAGSYEHLSVGSLTGVKFKKIYNLPVFNAERVQPNQDSNEMGLSYKDSIQTSISFPEVYGLKPVENDFVELNYGIRNKVDKIMYVITNVNLAHHGEYLNVYKCDLKVATVSKEDVEKQLSEVNIFYEFTKTIIPVTNYNLLNKLIQRSSSNIDNLKNLFQHTSNVYLDLIEI